MCCSSQQQQHFFCLLFYAFFLSSNPQLRSLLRRIDSVVTISYNLLQATVLQSEERESCAIVYVEAMYCNVASHSSNDWYINKLLENKTRSRTQTCRSTLQTRPSILMSSKMSPSDSSFSRIFLSRGIWPFPRIWSTLEHTQTHNHTHKHKHNKTLMTGRKK